MHAETKVPQTKSRSIDDATSQSLKYMHVNLYILDTQKESIVIVGHYLVYFEISSKKVRG